MQRLADEHGGVDVLVNNAGVQHVAPLEEFPAARWDLIIAVNLSSAFHTTRLALPSMRDKQRGRIVNLASAHGLVGSPYKSAYVAAKHGLVGLTKVTALETARTPITCNAVCPRLGRDAAGARADRRARGRERPQLRRRAPRPARREAPVGRVRQHRAGSAP